MYHFKLPIITVFAKEQTFVNFELEEYIRTKHATFIEKFGNLLNTQKV